MLRCFLACLLVVLIPAPGFSEGAVPGRYQLKEMDGGVVRLDTATGDLAFCKDKDGTPDCAALKDVSSKEEIDALKARITRLESQMADLKPGPAKLPSDEEVDRSLSIMQKFMRSFFGMVEEFDRKNNESNTLPQKM